MEFVRSRKAQSVHSSASPPRPPQGQSRTDNVPLDNVSRESDSPQDAAPSQRPQVERMEEDAKEGKPSPPPAVIGTGQFRAVLLLFFFALSFFAEVCSCFFSSSFKLQPRCWDGEINGSGPIHYEADDQVWLLLISPLHQFCFYLPAFLLTIKASIRLIE